MKYSENAIIIKEYLTVFRKYAHDGIIDMDAYLKHPFSVQIHRLEDIVPAWEGIVPAYRQSQFLIALIRKGTGEKTIGHLSFPIQRNTLFVVPGRVSNSSKYYSLECSGFVLSFDIGALFKHAPSKSLITGKGIFKKSAKPFMILTDEQEEVLSAVFEGILDEYHRQLTNKDEMIAAKVFELLLQCDRYFASIAPYKNEESYIGVMESFNELLQEHFSKERSVRYYANALHIHPNYLNFLIKKYTGMTAKQMIADHLFLEAKEFLGCPSLSVKEIAYRLGFTTPGSFSSFFRKMSGMSPSEFQQQVPGSG